MIFEHEESTQPHARVKVIGVGDAGGNAVNRIISEGLEGVECIAVNTDAQALNMSLAQVKIQIGSNLTRGLGAGSRPEIGRDALLENEVEVRRAVAEADLIFIAVGMGGGTGTGAAPRIAELARETGALTIAIATKPFAFEGQKRLRQAENGLSRLRQAADTTVVVPNERLLSLIGQGSTYREALGRSDDAVFTIVQGITDLIQVKGEVNVDFADVRTLMSIGGRVLVGFGYGEGEDRARQAAEMALSSPMLDTDSIRGAVGMLINITGGVDLQIDEVTKISSILEDAVGDATEIIFGAVHDSNLAGQVRVMVLATGLDPHPAATGFDVEHVYPNGSVEGYESKRMMMGSASEVPEPAIAIAWDPDVIDPDTYAEIVEILGELTRREGGRGITRIRSEGFGIPALDEVVA